MEGWTGGAEAVEDVEVMEKARRRRFTAAKLIIVDKLTAATKAKTVFVSKDKTAGLISKGTGTDAGAIDVVFSFDYANASTGGAFVLPAGASDGTSGWTVNKEKVAKYVNKSAPSGPTGAKVGVIKPGKLLKLVGQNLGDTAIDIFGTGAPDGSGVVTIYQVTNGAFARRHCTAFTSCIYKLIAGDTGAKLVCKPGTATTCP